MIERYHMVIHFPLTAGRALITFYFENTLGGPYKCRGGKWEDYGNRNNACL